MIGNSMPHSLMKRSLGHMHILRTKSIHNFQLNHKNRFSQAVIITITAGVAAVPTARSMSLSSVPRLHVFPGKGSSYLGFLTSGHSHFSPCVGYKRPHVSKVLADRTLLPVTICPHARRRRRAVLHLR